MEPAMQVIKKVVGKRTDERSGKNHYTNIGVLLEDDRGHQELILNYMPTHPEIRILLFELDDPELGAESH
ncbi:MAG: hypothetical protein KJO07_12165 [Deltaproteobacteria bacterium]|nr:hypothetical protein [Deltaproteobacteria bacterium]